MKTDKSTVTVLVIKVRHTPLYHRAMGGDASRLRGLPSHRLWAEARTLNSQAVERRLSAWC